MVCHFVLLAYQNIPRHSRHVCVGLHDHYHLYMCECFVHPQMNRAIDTLPDLSAKWKEFEPQLAQYKKDWEQQHPVSMHL